MSSPKPEEAAPAGRPAPSAAGGRPRTGPPGGGERRPRLRGGGELEQGERHRRQLLRRPRRRRSGHAVRLGRPRAYCRVRLHLLDSRRPAGRRGLCAVLPGPPRAGGTAHRPGSVEIRVAPLLYLDALLPGRRRVHVRCVAPGGPVALREERAGGLGEGWRYPPEDPSDWRTVPMPLKPCQQPAPHGVPGSRTGTRGLCPLHGDDRSGTVGTVRDGQGRRRAHCSPRVPAPPTADTGAAPGRPAARRPKCRPPAGPHRPPATVRAARRCSRNSRVERAPEASEPAHEPPPGGLRDPATVPMSCSASLGSGIGRALLSCQSTRRVASWVVGWHGPTHRAGDAPPAGAPSRSTSATGSSQWGQGPPGPRRRQKTLQSGQRCSPRRRAPQVGHCRPSPREGHGWGVPAPAPARRGGGARPLGGRRRSRSAGARTG